MKVYRFEKNEPERIKTILEESLYISSPEHFNDLEDCRIRAIYTPNFDEKTYKQAQACIEILYENEDNNYFPLPINILEKLKKYLTFSEPYDRNANDHLWTDINKVSIVNMVRNHLRKSTAICCFFKGAPTHPLMWAHYADSHTGFCIEYEVDDAEHPLTEVNYTTKALTPSINELLFCPHETIIEIFTTKSIEWNYEKEVRLICLNELNNEENGKKIPLPDKMRASRLIKGGKFDESKNTQLLKSLKIKKIPYQKFVKEHNNHGYNL